MSQLCERCEANLVNNQCLACGYQEPPTRKDSLEGLLFAGRYLLTRKVGEGSFGAVYEAEHQSLSRRVAVKVLHPHLVKRSQVLVRFQREALAMGKLSHPYAVKLYDQGEENGLHWIVLEWLEGETLEKRLSRQKYLAEREVISMLLALCEVIEEAHQRGTLHRDIKPSNIFLHSVSAPDPCSPFPIPRLLDFGLARLQELESMTASQNISGTPRYMAPEQWEGLQKARAQSDIYSLAVVAYECLSGTFPFEADNPIAWVRKLETERPRNLKEAMGGRALSANLAHVIMRCLEKDPNKRPKEVAQLRQEVEAIASTPRPKPKRSWPYAVAITPLAFLGGYFAAPPKIETPKAAPIITPLLTTPSPTISSQPTIIEQPTSLEEKPKKLSIKQPAKKEEDPNLLEGELKEPFEK